VVHDIGAKLVTHVVSIPNRSTPQTLHPLRSGLTHRLSQLPTILALDPVENADHVAPDPLTHFRAREARGKARLDLRHLVSPAAPQTLERLDIS
jgi:hypothetical protein